MRKVRLLLLVPVLFLVAGVVVPTAEEFAALEARVGVLEDQVSSLRAVDAAQDARLTELESALDALTARGLIGWNRDDDRFGAKRVYFTWSQRANIAPVVSDLLARGVRPLVSLKPPSGAPGGWRAVASGQYDAQLRQVFDALPQCENVCIDFAFHHEPEDDAPSNAADFRAAFDRVAALAPAHVRPVVVLMGWTAEPASGRVWADWVPASAQAIAVDVYNWAYSTSRPGAAWTSPAEMMAPVLALADRPVLVWETNSYEDPADPLRKAAWLLEWAELAETEQVEQVVFFDSASGQPNTFRLFSSPAAALAVDEMLAHPYFDRS